MNAGGAQLELFAGPVAAVCAGCTPWNCECEHLGWERHFLAELAAAPCICCYPGFTGAMHERLVENGHATRTDAGFMPYPEGVTPRQAKQWGWKATDHPQFEYAITDAGRAILQSLAP